MRGVLPLRFGTPMPAGASSLLPALARRQFVKREEDDDDYVYFWYTSTGIIIKYVIFFTFLFIIFAWVVGGRVHAKRRLRKGLKPLSYHAWLLSRQERAQVDPAYAYPQPVVYGVYRPVYPNNGTSNAEYYGMHSVPPPVYDPSRPPVYEGPNGGSKVDPAQGQAQGQGPAPAPAPDYAPPAGPPPGRYQ